MASSVLLVAEACPAAGTPLNGLSLPEELALQLLDEEGSVAGEPGADRDDGDPIRDIAVRGEASLATAARSPASSLAAMQARKPVG